MTKEEAIGILNETQVVYFAPKGKQKAQEALDMAISALMREQQFMYNASQGTTTILKIGNRHFEVRERMV